MINKHKGVAVLTKMFRHAPISTAQRLTTTVGLLSYEVCLLQLSLLQAGPKSRRDKATRRGSLSQRDILEVGAIGRRGDQS